MTRWPEGVGRIVLAETDSTNAEAARQAARGLVGPVWIMARRQTAGRGRQGRRWEAPEGNLAASLLCRPACSAAEAALRSFVASLAVADLFAALAPGAEVRLKWPNDALLNGRKAAGVLLESGGRGGTIDWLVVGVGVNLAAAPPAEAIRPGGLVPTSVAAEGGRAADPEEALALLAAAFAGWEGRLATAGFGAIRDAWLARAARLGQPVEARLAGERIEGIFEDVDAGGALVLRTPGGAVRRIAAADISFPD